MLQSGQRAVERAQHEQDRLIRVILAGHDIDLPDEDVQYHLDSKTNILTLGLPDDQNSTVQEEATPAA